MTSPSSTQGERAAALREGEQEFRAAYVPVRRSPVITGLRRSVGASSGQSSIGFGLRHPRQLQPGHLYGTRDVNRFRSPSHQRVRDRERVPLHRGHLDSVWLMFPTV